jgi:hypothetical protein
MRLTKRAPDSINQRVTLAVAEKVSALMTEEYLALRAKRGSRAKFEKAMAKVAKGIPEEHDRLATDSKR